MVWLELGLDDKVRVTPFYRLSEYILGITELKSPAKPSLEIDR